MAGQTDGWTLLIIVGLTCVTVLTRSFFMLFERALKLPPWAQRGLKYAPMAALAAVVLPEVITTQGLLIRTLADARLFGALAGMLAYFWRRHVLDTIVAGMAVYLPLHLWLGW